MDSTENVSPDDLVSSLGTAFGELLTGVTASSTPLTKTLLVPFETQPTYLGGLAPGITNRLSPSSPYGSLPRLQSLSPPKKAKFVNADQENVYLNMFEGNVSLEWRSTENVLYLQASCGDQDSCPETLRGPLLELHVEHGSSDEADNLAYNTKVEGRLDTTLGFNVLNPALTFTFNQSSALAARIVHHLLRTHGATLNDNILVIGAYHLSQLYRGKKQWAEMLDIAMVYADVIINNKDSPKRDIVLSLNGVGEILDCMGRYQEAGTIYRQAAQEYADGTQDAGFMFAAAGLAFKRGGEYVESEKAYIAALYWGFSTREGEWNLNVLPTATIFSNILLMYYRYSWKQAATLSAVLAALLSLAGYHGVEGTFSAKMVSDAGSQHGSILRPNFASQRSAKRALMRAVNANNVARFRSELLKCKRRDVKLKALFEEDKSSAAQWVKEVTRQRLVQGDAVDVISCAHCRATEERKARNFLCCPCHTVYYCQKSCQVAHWKAEHKHVCPYNAKKDKVAAK